MKSIYTFINYRHYLKAFYEAKKAANKAFSYQTFALCAGFTTKSYLIEIIAGRKSLSKNSIYKVAEAMGLKKKETEYFEALVLFNEAKAIKEREFYFDRIKTLAGKAKAKHIGVDQYRYFSQWYHPVIRELVTMGCFKGDFAQLAKQLKPSISQKQAKESVDLLLSLGLIKKSAGSTYKLSDANVTTGDEVTSLAILKYQQENLGLATQALDTVPVRERDISTLTAGISAECAGILKKEIQLFRKRLIQIIDDDKNPDRVVQINFQFFPVSEMPKQEQ